MLDPSPTTRGAPIADSAAAPDRALWIWRHPRAQQTQGRCIGRTDLAVSGTPCQAAGPPHPPDGTARRAGTLCSPHRWHAAGPWGVSCNAGAGSIGLTWHCWRWTLAIGTAKPGSTSRRAPSTPGAPPFCTTAQGRRQSARAVHPRGLATAQRARLGRRPWRLGAGAAMAGQRPAPHQAAGPWAMLETAGPIADPAADPIAGSIAGSIAGPTAAPMPAAPLPLPLSPLTTAGLA